MSNSRVSCLVNSTSSTYYHIASNDSLNISPPTPPLLQTIFTKKNYVNTENIILNKSKSKADIVLNHIKDAIENNPPIESKLNVIAVISNVYCFKKRWLLMCDFIRRMEFENNVRLFIVELAYYDQPFMITSSDNKNHLQLRTNSVLWHKENLINIGVKKLLPDDWKAFAWIDADVEFDNNDWALDTLKVLNGCRDIVQIFSHCLDMDANEQVMSVFNSFAFQYEKRLPYSYSNCNYWHPGFAWACTREAYERMGGLFEIAILGSGDHIMSSCLINKGLENISKDFSPAYKQIITDYQNKVKRMRLGYIPGIIRHFFHGSKKNRKYIERNTILFKYNYDPVLHISRDSNGLLICSDDFCKGFQDEILGYFLQRNEDE